MQAKHNQPPVGGPIGGGRRAYAREMDATGISTAILSIASMHNIWFEADPKTVPALARAINDYAAKMMRDHPGRFGLFATLRCPTLKRASPK